MISTNKLGDLIILTADHNMEYTMKGLISRYQSLGIRSLSYNIYVHPYRDPGCLFSQHTILQPLNDKYDYAIVMFDREGCGKDNHNRVDLELRVEEKLSRFGWINRSIALVLDPELEKWVWKESPHVDSALGWSNQKISLRYWLIENGYLEQGASVPKRPKEAMEAALRYVHKPRSSDIYYQLAISVGLNQCNDYTFIKLKETLQKWFPLEN